jgi:hypothetical protein
MPGSPAIKNAILLAIWQWVSLWLVAIMVVNTVLYNGFETVEPNSDGWPRIVVVIIYAVIYVLHSIYIWGCFFGAYTFITMSASWTFLSDAGFVVVDRTRHEVECAKGDAMTRSLTVREIDKSTAGPEFVPASFPANLYYIGANAAADADAAAVAEAAAEADAAAEAEERRDEKAIKKVRLKQEAEIKVVESATEAALDRVVFNATILLGISVVTSFSTWTPRQASNSTSTQLGSLALLASASSGLAALLSSAYHASHMRSSAEEILRVKEMVINRKAADYGHRSQHDQENPATGFTTQNTLERHRVLPWHLLHVRKPYQIIPSLFFGPAYILLPTRDEAQLRFGSDQFELNLDCRTHRVVLTSWPLNSYHQENRYNVYSRMAQNGQQNGQ